MTDELTLREKVDREVMNAVFSGFEHGQCEKEWEAPYGREIVSLALAAIASILEDTGSPAHMRVAAELRGLDDA